MTEFRVTADGLHSLLERHGFIIQPEIFLIKLVIGATVAASLTLHWLIGPGHEEGPAETDHAIPGNLAQSGLASVERDQIGRSGSSITWRPVDQKECHR